MRETGIVNNDICDILSGLVVCSDWVVLSLGDGKPDPAGCDSPDGREGAVDVRIKLVAAVSDRRNGDDRRSPLQDDVELAER
jgi:hypothetical protein